MLKLVVGQVGRADYWQIEVGPVSDQFLKPPSE